MKLQALTRYLSGKESYREIGKSIGIDHKSIVKWVRQYNYNGAEALVKRCTSYTQMFKLEVLQYMTENGTSLCETAAFFNIPAHSTLAVWIRKFKTQGIEALQSQEQGRLSMKKDSNKQSSTDRSFEALENRIKQLEMENEYLKKLNALVQNKEKSPNKTKHK